MRIEDKYKEKSNKPSDINEHFPTLRKYASLCESITEIGGVREINATWALLAGKPKKMISYEIKNPIFWGGDINLVYDIAKENNINYQFIENPDYLKIKISQTDLLFIDTIHSYSHLKKELENHSKFVNKFIIIHDTTSYEKQGVWKAIEEFLNQNKEWSLKERFKNNNGLTILSKEEQNEKTISSSTGSISNK
jgi:hypothetical protein